MHPTDVFCLFIAFKHHIGHTEIKQETQQNIPALMSLWSGGEKVKNKIIKQNTQNVSVMHAMEKNKVERKK